MTAIRIGIDYRPGLFGRGGIAVYTRELVRALAAACPEDEIALYAKRFRDRGAGAAARAVPRAPNVRLVAGRLPSRALPWLERMGVGVGRLVGGADVLHWTDYTTLPAGGVPVVATVHDVLFDELPDCYTPAMISGLRAVTRRIVERAARLIVPSARTQAGLARHYGVDPERVAVVPHGRTPLPAAAPAREHAPYVLAVGTLEPRKNLERLVQAMERVRARGTELALVVVGARGWLDAPLLEALVRRPWAHALGAVGPERLAPLYAGAHVVAYPSLGEGFGLPVLEALGAGAPTLVGADTACADVAGDAALTVDPRDVEAIAAGLTRLAADTALRARLATAGPRRAAVFTWEAAARATRAVYAEALAGAPVAAS